MILGCAIAGAVFSFLLPLRMLPLYQARTSLDIQSQTGWSCDHRLQNLFGDRHQANDHHADEQHGLIYRAL